MSTYCVPLIASIKLYSYYISSDCEWSTFIQIMTLPVCNTGGQQLLTKKEKLLNYT